MSAVYLHVGEPKSATTYLQQTVWANRRELARRGVSLPGAGIHSHYRATQDLCRIARPPSDPAPSWAGQWDVLARQALRAERDALISHELLGGADDEQAARALESLAAADVHVIVTVRDFASVLPAEWQETVKHRNGQPWQRWLDDVAAAAPPADAARAGERARWFWRVHDTPSLLARWSHGLAAERVHVVTLPPPGTAPAVVWERFAAALGVDPAGIDPVDGRANASLGAVETELLRRLNRRLPDELPRWVYLREVKEHLAQEVLATRPAGARLRLPPERFDWAAGQSQRMTAALTVAGYHVAGDLDDLRPRPSREPYVAPGQVAAPELLDAALDSLAAVLTDRYRCGPRALRLRRIVGELGSRVRRSVA